MPRPAPLAARPSAGTAVVIGASVAGLNAAAALAEHFSEVILLDRDRLGPETDRPRRGVPQGQHVHALLKRGQLSMEARFPGLGDRMRARGAVEPNLGADTAWFAFGGMRPRYRSAMDLMSLSRPAMEACIREQALQDPRIRVDGGRTWTGVELDAAGRRLVAVRVRRADGVEERLPADLVVDASGRGSLTPRFLQELGFESPAETVITSRVAYATRIYRRLPQVMRRWEVCYVQPGVENGSRGGIIAPIEGDRVVVTLFGMAGDAPPTDEAGFLAYARSLPSPELSSFLMLSVPDGPIVSFTRAENRRRHYERLRRPLEGLLVMGDAFCALNPVYGQGMTVAALSADALSGVLRAHRRGDALEITGLAARFQAALSGVVAVPWQMATGEDARWPLADNVGRQPLLQRLLGRFVDLVQRATLDSARISEAFYRVAQMVDAPTALLRPSFLFALGRCRYAARRRRALSRPRPQAAIARAA